METERQRSYRGAHSNFMLQMRGAEETAREQWRRWLAEGFVEVAPGLLRHPETGAEVHNG